jgi:hypothetical protein
MMAAINQPGSISSENMRNEVKPPANKSVTMAIRIYTTFK